MSKRSYKTAAELMAEIQADPKLRERQAHANDRQDRVKETLKAEDDAVCKSLREIGIRAYSVYDLLKRRANCVEATPVLIQWLPLAQSPRIKEGIVRALSHRQAGKEAAEALIVAFEEEADKKTCDEGLKWAIGNAISEAADATMTEDLTRLLVDKKYGSARQMLAIALGRNARKDRATRERALEVLLSLLDDPIVQGHAVIGLRHLNDEGARAALEGFVDHEKAWIRKEAKHALAKLDKAVGKR